ncbi:related to MLH3-insertion and deletion mismatch repair protein [Sporisorium reilianum f. sp. reilianum]|uniref:Related to MLH3-insertion and deletion mismatch repair protein n=1 Tax=Sporisorium reilianum f. sp. reilianum TaxID=72559 RepID=A0A2N8UG41_9BASI|nr:related to MLH3-insertion and deletion mismatch repair protein [Sporisorium reilianum f. sp. reilianum]DBA11304.1 TPA_inf: MLH3 [Sporisorium reilianum f. sp. reilianum]
MDAIARLPDATAASIQASLLAVTIQDICRILFRHALGQCRDVFGSSSGRIDVSVDYDLWTVTVTIDVDHSSIRSLPSTDDQATRGKHSELRSISYLGLVQVASSSSSGRKTYIWQDGHQVKSQSAPVQLDATPYPIASDSGRGVTVCMRDVFSGMPVRRKLIASEATKKGQMSQLVNCVRELSLLAPDSSIRLSVRHAAPPDGSAPASKVLLSLPRAKDLVQRCRSVFGADSGQLKNARVIAAEHTFASAKMSVNGFVAAAASSDAPRFIFLQQRVWPGAVTGGSSQLSERDAAVFASVLSTFHLPWTDEISGRQTRRTALSQEFYAKVCQRITTLPTDSASDEETRIPPAFVLDITLNDNSQEEHACGSELTAASFEAAVLDAICPGSILAESISSVKRKRSNRHSTADERGEKQDGIRLVKARPATASLAKGSWGPAATLLEGMVEWRNPVNGRLFHIDQRTGHSVAVRPTPFSSGDDGKPASIWARKSRSSAGVDRSSLNKGLDALPSKRQLAAALDDSASIDEFEDPSLDKALASIPSPSGVSISDPFRQSRFFESNRPRSPLKRTFSRSFHDEGPDVHSAASQRKNLELAITRSDLQTADVLDQVDGKFILCSTSSSSSSALNPVLFCIDQHAADERYRLERLLQQYASDCAAGTAAHPLPSTFTLGIAVQQYELVSGNASVRSDLQRLGWSIKEVVLVHAALGHAQMDLDGIPHVLKDKALTDRGRVKDQDLLQSAFANCLEEVAALSTSLSRLSAVEKTDWLTISRSIPTSLMDVIKSTACRSAIMFNDPLSREASERLVRRLGECKFPFQCAHGRPSLVPLCEVRSGHKARSGDSADVDG